MFSFLFYRGNLLLACPYKMAITNEFIVPDNDFVTNHKDSIIMLTGGSSGRQVTSIVFCDVNEDGSSETLAMSEQEQNHSNEQNIQYILI
jgi:hypothetical protein